MIKIDFEYSIADNAWIVWARDRQGHDRIPLIIKIEKGKPCLSGSPMERSAIFYETDFDLPFEALIGELVSGLERANLMKPISATTAENLAIREELKRLREQHDHLLKSMTSIALNALEIREIK